MHEIEKFIHGFKRFQERYYGPEQALFDQLRQGQKPSTLLIGCCDSRADPALLMGCDPGELFVLRNVANLVPPCDHGGELHGMMAAIQYAVEDLAVSRVIVLGHANCGGIRALMDGHTRPPEAQGPDFIRRWINIASPARESTLKAMPERNHDEQRQACEQAAILVSLENLRSFEWLRQRETAGKLSIHGWYFDLQAGALHGYSTRQGRFLPLVSPLRPASTET